ncbi:MAG: hypothetical protein ACP5XB_30275 [Isosphaeraceae bacterium]
MSEYTGDELTQKANAAFRRAAAKVLERVRQSGTQVIIWENGRVVERSPEELECLLTQDSPARASKTDRQDEGVK